MGEVKVLKVADEAKVAALQEKIHHAKGVAQLSAVAAVGGLFLFGLGWILICIAPAYVLVSFTVGVAVFGFSVVTSLWWYMRYLGFVAELREVAGAQPSQRL